MKNRGRELNNLKSPVIGANEQTELVTDW
jgi:hypothetical protein